ncbi:DegT/DnrJ/EryC1/StrS family aminotransferase [Acidimicrobiia bacterium]|nr:DegT/DnrJ/EryC1/StrS family aminotransferase [Acidimicrobiia bacterium]
MIKFNETYKSKSLKKYLNDLSQNNSFLSNKYRDICNEHISENYNYKYFLLTHSATAALEVSAMILKEDEKYKNSSVFMPSYTFSSTANAFLRSNYDVKFIDIDPATMMAETSKLPLKKNDIFVPVHYAGSYFDFDEFFINNNRKDITIIEDSAQAFGVKYKNKLAGNYGRMSCFSFHPTKNIHAGFGGMLTFQNKRDYESAQYIYERGTDRSKVISGQKKKYEWVSLGSSFEMSELSSAVLLSQLEDVDYIQSRKKFIYQLYQNNLQALIDEGTIRTQEIPNFIESNYHSFYILLNETNSNFINYLYENGVQSYIGYTPLHSSKYGRKNNLYTKLKNTEFYHKRLVRLPSHANLTDSEVNFITNIVKKYFI